MNNVKKLLNQVFADIFRWQARINFRKIKNKNAPIHLFSTT